MNPYGLFAVDYFRMKAAVIEAGGWHEIRWQADAASQDLNEERFLRELAWVVMSSGLSVRTVERCFPLVSAAFYRFESAETIVQNRSKCRRAALAAFGHEGKIDAILVAADRVARDGLGLIREALGSANPLPVLQTFPFIGPVTSRHLAKNLGCAVAKPDRHLVRLAGDYGYSSVDEFCGDVAAVAGDPVSVVDVVMWRFRASGMSLGAIEGSYTGPETGVVAHT